ncbi:MAG: carboxylating nicotinate-nucleotide diphosphorylase [Firmicutes bacterium]|nr:carboxylating nicotinate-nucleotide diphosphorylase [Bacillota bacterium]
MNELSYRELITVALREDQADFDVTSLAVVPAEAKGQAQIVAKREGVLAGLPVAAAVFAAVDPGVEWESGLTDGARLRPGLVVATIRGRLRAILAAERVALNFLQHLSGIATATAALVERVKDYPVKILDTRKPTPGLRALEKYAVRVGGGANHRLSLADMILIKDNHIAVAGGVTAAVRRARAAAPPFLLVEVEAENEDQVREALAAGADVIMLDNMSPAEMRRMVGLVAGRAKLEASGNITPENVTEVAATGVDYISVGYITHSAPAVDLSLEVSPL